MWIMTTITVLVGYLLGNLNGAVFASKAMGDDVRTHGSGNAGLTNFIRSYGAAKSIVVILIDAAKAVIACVLGGLLLKSYFGFQCGSAIGGVAVMFGHTCPVFLGFHGGKGILSGFFIAVVTDYRVALLALAVFALLYFLTGYVSLGSVFGALTLGTTYVLFNFGSWIVMGCGVFMGLLATVMHWKNILRLLKGEERKTNLFK